MARPLGFLARVAALALFATAAPAQSPGSPAPPAAAIDRVLPLDVTVNGSKGGTWVFVERRGVMYAPRDAFEEWRVQLNPEAPSIDFRGETYWALAAVPGYKAKVDFSTQSLELAFSPEVFSALKLSRELDKRLPVSPVLPSVFLNYDFNYTGSRFDQAGNVHDAGLLSELGVSGS